MKRFLCASSVLVEAAVALALAGCGGYSGQTPRNNPAPNPASANVNINGRYNLVLTSTNGHGTTNIYTNFTQTGNTFTGAANTLVCPSNDLSQCQGGDPSVVSITPSGTVSGANVTVTISFPSTAGTDTVTMTGIATGSSLAGSYTDSLGDAGTWTASTAIHLFAPGAGYSYSGTFNSTAHPLQIAPTISIELLGHDSSSDPTGTATIMNSPCISSLSLSGQAIGDALRETDAESKALILALPTQPTLPTGNSFTFSYRFEPTAPSCAGDFGRGVLTITAAFGWWDY